MKPRSLMFLICLLGAVTAASAQEPAGAKNVILFVGDGLGAGQMALGIQYARMVEGRELNLGQLSYILQAEYPDYRFAGYDKVQGKPFTAFELRETFTEMLEVVS